jgi:hypothetical protein
LAKQDDCCRQKLDQGNERERHLIIGRRVTHRANAVPVTSSRVSLQSLKNGRIRRA